MKLFNLATFIFLYAIIAYGQQTPCGIGAAMLIVPHPEGDRLQIAGVASNSPAAQAGLAVNQLVLAIDGVPTRGMTFKECVKRIQGKAGTKVVLEITDRHYAWTNSIAVTRKVVADDPLAIDTAKWIEIPDAQKRKSFLITTNQVVRVSRTNGAVALIQFTQFGTTNANYRWRSRSVSGTVSSGMGFVFENYDRHVDAFGGVQLTQRGSQDDLYVKAGDFRLEWSKDNETSGWLYYYPAREKIEILDSSAFDSDRW